MWIKLYVGMFCHFSLYYKNNCIYLIEILLDVQLFNFSGYSNVKKTLVNLIFLLSTFTKTAACFLSRIL